MTPSDLASRVTTTANVDQRMIQVRVRDSSASRAAAIATKLVEVMARNPNLTEPAPAAQVTPYDLPTMGQQIKGRTQQMTLLAVLAALDHPRFGALFATAGVRGLTDLLTSKSAGPLPPVPWLLGLTVVPAGAAVAACGSLLNSAQMATLIRALSERVELLILRTSSVRAATDALLLAGQVDAVLLIARRGRTSQKALGQACRDIELAGGHVIGGLLVQPVRFPKAEARPRPKPGRSFSTVDGSTITGEPTE